MNRLAKTAKSLLLACGVLMALPVPLWADRLPLKDETAEVAGADAVEISQQPDTVAAYLQLDKVQRESLLRQRVRNLHDNLSQGLMPSGIKKPGFLLRQHFSVASTLNRYFSLGSPPDHPYQVRAISILDSAISSAEKNLAFDDVFEDRISQIVVTNISKTDL